MLLYIHLFNCFVSFRLLHLCVASTHRVTWAPNHLSKAASSSSADCMASRINLFALDTASSDIKPIQQ